MTHSSQSIESNLQLEETLKELKDVKHALDESTIVAITDRNGVITHVNDAFCKISKYSREELVGQTHRLINSGHHPKKFFGEMWNTIESGKVWHNEIRNQAKDGTYYWVDTTIVPFLNDDGEPYQYIAIRHDISQRKRIEDEIRLLNEELEVRVEERTRELAEANKDLKTALFKLKETEHFRDTFISALTHDLKTPLVGEKRALELLDSEKSQLPPELARLVERLLKSNDNLLNMVATLLDIYQYESGKVTIVKKPVDLFQMVKECIVETRLLADMKEITLENNLPYGMPLIHGDYQQIKRVIMNLISNAIDNIPSGSFVNFCDDVTETEVLMKVEDNGPGIREDIKPYLFQRYFISNKTKKIGSGLGLYICKMIMEHHGGRIWVESEPGKGACFYLTFPRENSDEGINDDD